MFVVYGKISYTYSYVYESDEQCFKKKEKKRSQFIQIFLFRRK